MSDHKPAVPYPRASKSFNWLFAIFSAWMVVGLFVDNLVQTSSGQKLVMIFDPDQGLFFVGFGILMGLMFLAMMRAKNNGYKWPHLLPKHYMMSFLGGLVFLVGILVSEAWNVQFGVESNLDAIASPAHLLVLIGAAMMIAGPLRSTWHHPERPTTLKAGLPTLISAGLLWGVISFVTQFANPAIRPWMTVLRGQFTDSVSAGMLGLSGVIIQSAIMIGVVFFVMREWRLPFGSFIVLFGIRASLIALLGGEWRFFLSAMISALIIEVLYETAFEEKWSVRAFGFLAPFIYWSVYSITIFLTEGTWWSFHLWTGQIVLAGLTGWLVSYLLIDPASENHTIARLVK